MRNLIRKVLFEQTEQKILTGCNVFQKDSYDYKWCKMAEASLSKNRIIAFKAIQDYKKNFLTEFETGLRAQLYDKEHKFFTDRRNVVIDALNKFKESCPKFYNYVVKKMLDFKKEYVILNSQNEYDLLNKLNSNWTAIALILTLGVPEEYKNLRTYSISDAQKWFFRNVGLDGLTLFEKFMGNWGKENMKEITDKVYDTIKQTTKEGQRIEDEFFDFVSKFVNAEQYSGDYSFMDMIGVDMIIENPEGKWVPVQVKKYGGACSEVSDRKDNYRSFMCENWCVSYEKKVWVIRTYKGDSLQKNKEQCKTKPLNMTCFLNVHSHETNHETCEPEIPKIDKEIDF